MDKKLPALALLIALFSVTGIHAQQPEIVVGDIGFPERVWGEQNLAFEVHNTTDWVKFLVIQTEVQFEGSYINPHRVRQTNFVATPGLVTVDPLVKIPPNYGIMNLTIRVIDVVDTLDNLSLGTQIFEQPFRIRFHAPEAVLPYFQERISLPPLVGNNGVFDNEFTRLLVVMLSEGKSLQEIADLCQASLEYTTLRAADLRRLNFLDFADGVYTPKLPVITGEYALDAKVLADSLAVKLAATIKKNLGGRQAMIDSLIAAGLYSGDANNFYEGGTLLHHPYPLIAGLYLWQGLGQKFIARHKPLLIYQGTDPCMPNIGEYTYLVHGGDYVTGHHYFSTALRADGFKTNFAAQIPDVICYPGFEKKAARRENAEWDFAPEWIPESFLYDTTLINPMMRTIDVGVDELLAQTSDELEELHKVYFDRAATGLGVRYWFWNLAATRTLDLLVDGGVLTQPGNGHFKFVERKR